MVWFSQVEAQYNFVIASLKPEIAQEVCNFIIIHRGFHYKEVSVTERRPLLGSVYSRECPLLRSVHYTEVSIIKGVRY